MLRRQNVRNAFLIISFLLFPITQFYFSPFLIIWGASKGLITASAVIFSMFFLFSLLFGRVFCGWLCPCGAMQEILFKVNNKNPKTGKLDYIKFFIWVPWMITIVTVALLAGGFKRADYFFVMDHGISVSNIYMYIPYYIVILLFFLNSIIFGKRANCHYLCWMSPFMIIGRKISNFFNIPSLRIKSEKDKCINCKKCNSECPMSLDVNNMVKCDKLENHECILCGKCADICPKNVIKFNFGRIQFAKKNRI
ncbi:polyferredoxin [Clostridium saccharoperbutylacetonicum]|uniref:4Fe-4S ferredoxin iron-sulfur binding domain-containing protein n=1 Tax=Clostridium saccharoperbutylacetonicum N1-4(HMT) TaxID=931276 RepID=M1MHV6_9CLOT|nr:MULTISPECIES: 4Fe-4S binding protein [Clostridium]AGF55903.1 4Fe-4S ferredoxin iron-sulfur binding domain-containing protein [Clostridium saccharoperbutylacetonicum N1-4(HMT)]NRT63358.1 polyferredoxin [Clostridium saccharoperbutylacetonicum]NSB26720.1 polyferredoxin [Clostridium saccharoperbutylacetonicum]NSB46071.1 polyferredoxin [Clostridium saccharoperbutylacetonicum]